MKRILAAAFALLLLLSVLSGCRPSPGSPSDCPPSSELLSAGAVSERGQSVFPPVEEAGESAPPAGAVSERGQSVFPPVEEAQESAPPAGEEEEPLFRYDPHRISADAREALTDREYGLYCRIVDSILAHDDAVDGFESAEDYKKVWNTLFREFVPFLQLCDPVLGWGPENDTVTLPYKADRESCDRRYARFENAINEALSTIKKGDGDRERIAKLYLYVADRMTYGNDLPEAYWNDFPERNAKNGAELYDHIVCLRGVCEDYARFLNLLAVQIGLEAKFAESSGSITYEHAWSLIRMEGEWYHFDPCWQQTSPPFKMEYFAIGTAARFSTLKDALGDKVEIFARNNWSRATEDIPECGTDMDQWERQNLYRQVIDDCRKTMGKAGASGGRLGTEE